MADDPNQHFEDFIASLKHPPEPHFMVYVKYKDRSKRPTESADLSGVELAEYRFNEQKERIEEDGIAEIVCVHFPHDAPYGTQVLFRKWNEEEGDNHYDPNGNKLT